MWFRLFLHCLILKSIDCSDGQDVARLGTLKEEELAVHLEVKDDLQTLESDGFTWICVTLKLRPEENVDRFVIPGVVKYPWKLPSKFRSIQATCNANGGVYARLDQLAAFVERATVAPADVQEGKGESASCKKPVEGAEGSLAEAISSWNNRFFNMDYPDTRMHSEKFHARGSEPSHLAMQVSLFTPPVELATRITQRLLNHSELFFVKMGIGKAGTTGATFVGGNAGFGTDSKTTNLMNTLFPAEFEHNIDGGHSEEDGDYMNAKDDRRTMFAEATTSSLDEDTASKDLREYETAMKETMMQRNDVRQFYGEDIADIDFQFQHRLWRFGPTFDSKSKGGIWHKDTCPFGINGALPEGSIMFTTVYILYTENLDLPTAGTRVKDSKGKIFQLPCEAGKGNMIRSGEDDPYTFFHSGPLQIKKLDPDRPAYRVMMQTKTVLTPKQGRRTVHPNAGHWRGLGVLKLSFKDDAPATTKREQLREWLSSTTKVVTYGIGESNALGSEGYPVNVHRAWTVAHDLCNFLGFKTAGVLPVQEDAATPVFVFGFDTYTYEMVRKLASVGFKVATIASEDMYTDFFNLRQDAYMNMQTMDIRREQAVRSSLQNQPFDMHLVVDIPVGGLHVDGSSYTDPVLSKFGDLLKEVASKPSGEGTISTVTVLSEMSPGSSREAVEKAENEWKQFGEEYNVRIVIFRLADRVYGGAHTVSYHAVGAKFCRRRNCSSGEAVTRIHSIDLANIVTRMLSMFDIVELHGEDPFMQQTASRASSLKRFPSGLVLNVVDDGPPSTMSEIRLYLGVATGKIQVRDLQQHIVDNPPEFADEPPWNFDLEANALMKKKLAYELSFPSYREGYNTYSQFSS